MKEVNKGRLKGMKAVCLWSGGKDSCFAYYKAKRENINIGHLLTFICEDNSKSLSHNLDSKLLFYQAQLTGLSVIHKQVSKISYEEVFKQTINQLRAEGVDAIIFGDIYLQEHKDWIDRVCAELAIKPIMPLWGMDTKVLIDEFISAGFEAIVVTVKNDILNDSYLGRKVDKEFIEELFRLNRGIDPCGEKGEFHTFITGGPLFKQRINITCVKKVLLENKWNLDILDYEIV
jgi:uncharacterized protein (TIGR00290 family)